MLRIELIHPMIVHFPIVLIILALATFIANAVTGKEFFAHVGAWVITLGAISAAVAVGAGLLAENNASHNDAAHVILEKFHKPLGLSVLALSVLLTIWGFVSRWRLSGLNRFAFIAVLFATVAVLSLAGHYGAMMVYESGMGVNSKLLKSMTHQHDHDEEADEHSDHNDKSGVSDHRMHMDDSDHAHDNEHDNARDETDKHSGASE